MKIKILANTLKCPDVQCAAVLIRNETEYKRFVDIMNKFNENPRAYNSYEDIKTWLNRNKFYVGIQSTVRCGREHLYVEEHRRHIYSNQIEISLDTLDEIADEYMHWSVPEDISHNTRGCIVYDNDGFVFREAVPNHSWTNWTSSTTPITINYSDSSSNPSPIDYWLGSASHT